MGRNVSEGKALPAAAREADPAKRSAAVIPQHDDAGAAGRDELAT